MVVAALLVVGSTPDGWMVPEFGEEEAMMVAVTPTTAPFGRDGAAWSVIVCAEAICGSTPRTSPATVRVSSFE